MPKRNVTLVVTLSLILAACSRGGSDGPVSDAVPAVPVTTTIAGTTDWVDEIEAVGTTKARESITLTAKITETVRKVNFTDGQKVHAV